jgi:hypothetical protein
MKRKHYLPNVELQQVIHEGFDRKGRQNHGILLTSEEDPIPVFDSKRYVVPEEIPECCDGEAQIIAMIDEGMLSLIETSGQEPRYQKPKRVKEVVRDLYTNTRQLIKAACYNSQTGLLVYIY